MFIFAGMIAALFSYICNKMVLKKLDTIGLTILVPFIEEFAKSFSAILLNTSVLGAHFIFGIIEGIYDLVNSSKSIGKLAALASIISHSLFGLATYLVLLQGYSIYWGIFLAWLFHSTWNWYITKYL